MGMMYYDYEFKSVDCQNTWRDILNNTFENVEFDYRKKFSMSKLLSIFKKAFGVTPITLKHGAINQDYNHKLLAIYLLTKYSKEEYKNIAKEFQVSLLTVGLIASNTTYNIILQDEIKLFFKQFEDDYLIERKSSLSFREDMMSEIDNILEEDSSS